MIVGSCRLWSCPGCWELRLRCLPCLCPCLARGRFAWSWWGGCTRCRHPSSCQRYPVCSGLHRAASRWAGTCSGVADERAWCTGGFWRAWGDAVLLSWGGAPMEPRCSTARRACVYHRRAFTFFLSVTHFPAGNGYVSARASPGLLPVSNGSSLGKIIPAKSPPPPSHSTQLATNSRKPDLRVITSQSGKGLMHHLVSA